MAPLPHLQIPFLICTHDKMGDLTGVNECSVASHGESFTSAYLIVTLDVVSSTYFPGNILLLQDSH